jgi:RNA ligase
MKSPVIHQVPKLRCGYMMNHEIIMGTPKMLLSTSSSPTNPPMDETFVGYPETRQFDRFRTWFVKHQPNIRKPEFHGTVKIHGSNVSIIFTSLNSWRIQSRHRILSAKEDLYDCYAKLNSAPLKTLAQEILRLENRASDEWRDIMIVGEWAGKGIQARVGVSSVKEKFLTIFNIRIGGVWQDIRKFRTISLPDSRIFNICDFPTYSLTIDLSSLKDVERAEEEMQTLVEQIDKKCPLAAQLGVEGCGEGVVYTYHPVEPDGTLYHFKVKGPSHQIVKKPKVWNVSAGMARSIATFIKYAVTEARLDQGITYLEEMNIPIEPESTGQYIKWVVQDVLKEESHQMEELGLKEKDIKSQLAKTIRNGWMIRLKVAQRKDLKPDEQTELGEVTEALHGVSTSSS